MLEQKDQKVDLPTWAYKILLNWTLNFNAQSNESWKDLIFMQINESSHWIAVEKLFNSFQVSINKNCNRDKEGMTINRMAKVNSARKSKISRVNKMVFTFGRQSE